MSRKDKSIMIDYPDEFIRKMRLTGLLSLRGGGRFLDMNHNEQAKVDYVLKTYALYQTFDDKSAYFNYMASMDKNLVFAPATEVKNSQKVDYLQKWVALYSWDVVKVELLNLSHRRGSKDNILKYIPAPVRLEFLSALAIKLRYPHLVVTPNYPVDDEGIPTSTAAGTGNQGDIECFYKDAGLLVEVTMSEGRTQTMMEVWPIARHLEEFSKKVKTAVCYFVAPSIFTDTIKQAAYVQQTEQRRIIPNTIADFTLMLDTRQNLDQESSSVKNSCKP